VPDPMKTNAPELPSRARGRAAGAAVSAKGTWSRRIGELEAAERKLEIANAQLRAEIAAREHLEREARSVDHGNREVRERFECAFDNAPIGMALIAMDDRWLQVNDALCRIIGHSESALKATTLQAMTHPDDLDLDAQGMRQLLAGETPSYQVEKRLRHAWGHQVWVLMTSSIVRDEDRRPLYVVTQVQDISERKELAKHVEYFVDHDFLTGLFNRRRFELELTKEIERVARYGSPGAVLVIDLDNFKDINDTFGHRAGDDHRSGTDPPRARTGPPDPLLPAHPRSPHRCDLPVRAPAPLAGRAAGGAAPA
jgi:PAS domain S-box-containing protein